MSYMVRKVVLCSLICSLFAFVSCAQKSSDADTKGQQMGPGGQTLVENAFSEGKSLICPENTHRVEKMDSSYPEFYCVGYEGRQGPWLEYDAYGRLIKRSAFKNDKYNGEWIQYHPNGKIETQGQIVDNNREGMWTQWYIGGNKRSVKHYLHNSIHGRVELYYLNGTLMADGVYENDLEEGQWKVYTPEGKLARECKMVHGEETDCVVHIKEFEIKSIKFGDRKIKFTEDS